MRRLLEECPEKGDALQGLAETHLIGHNTPVLILNDHSSGTLVEKLQDGKLADAMHTHVTAYLDSLDLMRSENFRQLWINNHSNFRILLLFLVPFAQ